MPAPIIPWQPSNIPLEIQQELDRRKTVRSFNFIANNVANWDSTGDWNSYKGPMMPWVRVCSNSAGHPAVNKPRFIFRGGKGFYDTYGFSQTSTNGSKYQIIGYMPTDPPIPHTIENSLRNPTNKRGQEQSNFPIHVPTPEISKVTVTVQKELYRRAEVEWTCFSWEQLVYMTPYFLVPGISVMMEWGWNHFNPMSLVDLNDTNQMAKLWRNAYPLYTNNIIQSKGNYDVVYGIITNFHWSMEGNRINCMTEITSKDRLYSGISKDMGLTVNDGSNDKDQPRPIFQALRDFVSKDATLLNLKTIAEEDNPLLEIARLSGGNVNNTPISGSIRGAETQNVIWRDIIRPILAEPDANVRGMKAPYIRGVFSGRPKKFFNDPKGLGKPSRYDFDKSNVDKLEKSKVWINMGMIVEILNYFSGLDGGKGEPMFQVDVMNTVISGHPNLISCDRRVLIPNAGAPRAHYGNIGLLNYGPRGNDTGTPYFDQRADPQDVKSAADIVLRSVCSQVPGPKQPRGGKVCYRQNLDKAINFLRYRFPSAPRLGSTNLGYSNYMKSFAFPATETKNLPASPTGLAGPVTNDPNAPRGNVVEEGTSGLFTDIYLNYAAFVETVMDPDPKLGSYVDIYNKLLSILNSAVDGFWDLALVEVDNIMTIVDKNYLSTQTKIKQDVNPTYSFDYSDADSIIRSFRFRPALSDAQATRAIYGEVNNPNSKYVYVDKNDLLNYQFKDAIVMNTKDRTQGDLDSDLAKRNTARQQMNDVIGEVQKLNTSEDDDTLQMTINRGTTQTIYTGGGGFDGAYAPVVSQEIETGPFEYLKLCLPSSVAKQVFRLLLDDKDEDNNPRYCAIQPGITAELTLLGIGGLRTFQYFLVKNLPAPYDHRSIIFRIIDVTHHISQEQAGWETKITAGILPLRKYIKTRLVPPKGGWSEPVNPTIP